jgi:site-specific DNA recombinase
VQNLMKENTEGRRGKRHRSGALLTGLIYDDRGNRMSPTFTVKNGVRYPFYVSTALLKGRKEASGSVARVPAAEIEVAVLQALGLSKPEQAQQPGPAELHTELAALISKLIVKPAGCTIVYADKRPALDLQVDWKERDPYGRMSSALLENDPKRLALVHSIAQARHWIELLTLNQVDSIETLAKRERIHPKILRTKLRLAFVAPSEIAAALGNGSWGEEIGGNLQRSTQTGLQTCRLTFNQ